MDKQLEQRRRAEGAERSDGRAQALEQKEGGGTCVWPDAGRQSETCRSDAARSDTQKLSVSHGGTAARHIRPVPSVAPQLFVFHASGAHWTE